MNHSLHTADRVTYRKIVAVAAAAAVAMTFVTSYGRGESNIDRPDRKVAVYRPAAPDGHQPFALAELKWSRGNGRTGLDLTRP